MKCPRAAELWRDEFNMEDPLVRAHLASCPQCRADVEWLTRLTAGLAALPRLEIPSQMAMMRESLLRDVAGRSFACAEVQEILPAWRDGALDHIQAFLVEDHLLWCDPCSVFLMQLEQVTSLLRAIPVIEPPAIIAERIAAARMPWWRRWIPAPAPLWGYSGLATAAVAAIFLCVLFMNKQQIVAYYHKIAPRQVTPGMKGIVHQDHLPLPGNLKLAELPKYAGLPLISEMQPAGPRPNVVNIPWLTKQGMTENSPFENNALYLTRILPHKVYQIAAINCCGPWPWEDTRTLPAMAQPQLVPANIMSLQSARSLSMPQPVDHVLPDFMPDVTAADTSRELLTQSLVNYTTPLVIASGKLTPNQTIRGVEPFLIAAESAEETEQDLLDIARQNEISDAEELSSSIPDSIKIARVDVTSPDLSGSKPNAEDIQTHNPYRDHR